MDSDPAQQQVIVLRVVIRSPDLETFVSKYSRFVKDDRIFIFTKSSQPPGTRVRFTLELADGMPLIHGEGTVTRVRADTGDATKPPGMELKFIPLDGPSRDLVARMLAVRDGQFREESTDAQTNVRDAGAPQPVPAEELSRPVLPPLQKTGKLPSLDDLPVPRQDESGAVTLAQAPPGTRASHELHAPGALPGAFPASPTTPDAALPAENGHAEGNRQSGGFSTPTPLPAPIPASGDEFSGAPPPSTRLERPPARDVGEASEAPFAGVGPAPPFAEAFRHALPGAPPPTPAPSGTVPANPFSEVSDGAIEYFVEWSLEQSTAPKPKVAEARFANVAMATPRVEKRRSSRGPLVAGLGLGLVLGVPLGGAAMWYYGPRPAPVIVEHMPEPQPLATATDTAPDLAPGAPDRGSLAAPARPSAELAARTPPSAAGVAASGAKASGTKVASGSKVASAAKPAPSGVAAKAPASGTAAKAPPSGAPASGVASAAPASGEAAKPEPVERVRKGELQLVTRPSGAAVSIDGEARGKTPLTLSLPSGTHELTLTRERYATVTQPVDVPGKVEVTLKRPVATLHVDSDPPGGEVIVEGRPRGKTPVDVTLDAFHHYDVQVMLLGTKPWHKRVSLKPPQTDVTAKLSVVHNP